MSMETKLYLASAALLVCAILLYKFIKYEQRAQQDEGGMTESVTIGLWGSFIILVMLSILFLLDALMS